MPHIEEGLLHEYLDRSSDRDAELQYVTDHITGCPSCRARLTEAETLRAAARDILHAAAPAGLTAPSFESVMARSGQPPLRTAQDPVVIAPARHARRAIGVPRYAWAATVVLALGAGWIAHSLYRSGALDEGDAAVMIGEDGAPTQPGSTQPAATQAELTQTAPAQSAASPTAPPSAGTSSQSTLNQDRAVASPGAAGTASQRDALAAEDRASNRAGGQAAGQSVGQVGTGTTEAARKAAAAEVIPAEKAARADAQGFAARGRQEAGRAADSKATPPASMTPSAPPPPPRTQTAERSFQATAVAGGRADGDSSNTAASLMRAGVWRGTTLTDAAAMMHDALVTATGLTVIDVAVADADGAARVRVRHRMPAGDTIQIIQFRDAVMMRAAGPDTAFVPLAQGRMDATMYQLLRQGNRVLVVTGANSAIVDLAVARLRVEPPRR